MAGGVNVLVNTGVGFTVTTTFCIVLHPLAVVVYTYVTFTGKAVVLVSVSLTLATTPLLAPCDIPATAALLS